MVRNKRFRFPVNTLCGSGFRNFLKATRGHRIDRKGMYLLTGVSSFFLSVLGRPMELRDLRRTRGLASASPPVFIIGFWRSGTTLLHNLLCCHPDAAYVSTFQSIFPHHSPGNEWWLRPLVTPLLPRKRPADGVSLDFDLPQEEEIALGNLQALSFYYFMYFPDEIRDLIPRHLLLQEVSPQELSAWQCAYERLIGATQLRTGRTTFISKNPPNAFRIPLLLEMFPGARFISIFRNREEVIPSFHRFVTEVFRGISLQRWDDGKVLHDLEELYHLYQKKYEHDRKLIPAGRLLELQYEELLEDKRDVSRRLFRFLESTPEEEAQAMRCVSSFLGKMDEFHGGSDQK